MLGTRRLSPGKGACAPWRRDRGRTRRRGARPREGQANGRWLGRDERRLLDKRVDLVIETAERIDPEKRTVTFASGGSVDYDYLVIATGSRTLPERVPGFVGAGQKFYTLTGAITAMLDAKDAVTLFI